MANAYKDAGVDVEAGYTGVKKIKELVKRTPSRGVINQIGSFGAMFDLEKAGAAGQVLVSGTDGVGTKLLIAIALDQHETIGIDCVAMCANDVLAQGAYPLFFLDYLALGKNDPDLVEKIVSGVVEGCVQAECALIGGETAEMPGVYRPGHYDLAGFCVGSAPKDRLVSGDAIREGDLVIALASSGIHSNGYSLVRKIIADHELTLSSKVEGLEDLLGQELLKPTKIYVKPVKALIEKGVLPRGMAHITGGGFYENLPRILRDDLAMKLDLSDYEIPAIFSFLAGLEKLSMDEMAHIFNMGVGFVLVISPDQKEAVLESLKESGQEAFQIGTIVSCKQGEEQVQITW